MAASTGNPPTDLTPKVMDALGELLELLRTHGVRSFSGYGVDVAFGPAAKAPRKASDDPKVDQRNERPAPARPATPYDHASIWPDGQKPGFQ